MKYIFIFKNYIRKKNRTKILLVVKIKFILNI
jgi:hypothetical protein